MIAAAVYVGSVRQDAIQFASEKQTIAHGMGRLQKALTTTVRDYGWWTEAVRSLVLQLNKDWADLNIGPYAYATFGYEVALVIDGNSQPVIGWLKADRATELAAAELGPMLPALLADARRRQTGPAPIAVSAFLESPTGVFAAAASPIVPQPGYDGPLPAGPSTMLVFAKHLNRDFLDELASDFLPGPISLAPHDTVTTPDLGKVELIGPSGDVIKSIVWQPIHPGRAQLSWLIPALFGSFLVFVLFTTIVMRSIRQATGELRRSESRFRDFAEAASDWIWETDDNLQLTYVSEPFVSVTGLRPADVIGRYLNQLLEFCDTQPMPLHGPVFENNRPFRNLACTLRVQSGKMRTLRVSGRPIHDGRGAVRGYRGTATDISSEMAAIRQVEYLARHDPLTGLPNRATFNELLTQVLERVEIDGSRAALICIDLDRFKEVNDSLGHGAGDSVLIDCAERLKECVRETDLVARLGGDEFAVLLHDVSRTADVQALADRILTSLADVFVVGGAEVVVGASIGIALIPCHGTAAVKVLQHADLALYRAKFEGRNRACFFEKAMETRLLQRKTLEVALRNALAAEQLTLCYQPLVALASERMVGVEALLRWSHPDRGMVSPAEFIPVAEESGLILGIGDWVLHTACATAARWPELVISVNVSPAQFKHRDILRSVKSALAAAKIGAERLEIEITEGLLIHNSIDARTILHELRELGVSLSLDDFGTGYSSLSYLQRFRLDKIKIDRSFVTEISEENGAIVRAIIRLGQSLHIRTCAEGVETADQAHLLRREGCDQAQGFMYSAAVEPAMIDGLLASSTRLGGRQCHGACQFGLPDARQGGDRAA
jgi:diguanylate cyclase (GGDEF)-like protein/PAS domain S-box-containing protein